MYPLIDKEATGKQIKRITTGTDGLFSMWKL